MTFSYCKNERVSNVDIDNFISRYNDSSFNEIKNIAISQRSRGINEVVYVVAKSSGNMPVYFVTFDLVREKVISINKNNLEKANTKEYLTENEILNAVNAIRKHDFYLLSVDSLENVFVNPFHPEEPPYLLRLKVATGDSIVRKGYLYELYKENWYLNASRKEN
ncbi:MAG: hypothetical protein IT269_03185 [Saprospiraceae bacterium]|nr:hypothetical protein [Saprospiraceae bacterium]